MQTLSIKNEAHSVSDSLKIPLSESSLHLFPQIQDEKSRRHTIGINTCQQTRLTPLFLHAGYKAHRSRNIVLYWYFLPMDVRTDGGTQSPGCRRWTHCDSGFGGQWGISSRQGNHEIVANERFSIFFPPLLLSRRGGKNMRGKKGLRFCSHKAAAGAPSLNFEWATSSVFATRLSTKCDGKYSSGEALMFHT